MCVYDYQNEHKLLIHEFTITFRVLFTHLTAGKNEMKKQQMPHMLQENFAHITYT